MTPVSLLKTRHRLRNRCHPSLSKTQHRCHPSTPVPSQSRPQTQPLQHLQHHSRHHRNTSHDHHHTPNNLIFFPLRTQQSHTITHLSRMTFTFTNKLLVHKQPNNHQCLQHFKLSFVNGGRICSGIFQESWQRKNIGRGSTTWKQTNARAIQ